MQSSSITTMETPRSSAPASARTKQVGSVPAEGSGPNAAKIDPQSLTQAQGYGTNAETLHIESDSSQMSPASSTFQVSSSATPTSDIAAASTGQGSPFAPLPGSQVAESSTVAKTSMNKPATTFATRLSLGTGVATPVSQLPTSQVSSEPASSQLSVSSGGGATASTPRGSSTIEVAGPSLSVMPTASDNLAMAVAFNKGYKSLTFDSQCDPKDRLQMTVCINGLFASCNEAGLYTVSPCIEGKQCFALPLMTAGSTGINVMCESPSNAARVLQAESTAKSSQTTATTKLSSIPTTATLSATAMSSSLATSSDQSANTQATETSSAQPNSQTSTTSSNIEPSVVATTDATIEPSATPTSFQTPTTLSATQSSSATSSDAMTPSTTPIATTEQSFAAQASSSTDIPLIISFPSSLSSSPPEQSEEAPEPTKMLFPAPAAAAPKSVAVAEKLVQASPSQQAPTSVSTSAASTVPVAPAGITGLPMANDNDKPKERTVTVTVTTTERL